MKPDSDRVPNFNLPEPQSETGLPLYGHSAQPSNLGQSVGAPVQPFQLANPLATPTAPQAEAISAMPAGVEVDSYTEQAIAETKKIIKNTAQDPYLQSESIQRLKADFVRRTAGYDIKTLEEDS